MRTLAWLLAGAAVAALAAPALAAEFQLSGSIESSMVWRQRDWTDEQGATTDKRGVSAATTLKLNGTLGTANNGVRAVLELAPMEATKAFDPSERFSFESLGISKAYIEANGQLWQGGQPVTARIGTLEMNLSPYIATFAREGLSVAGLRYGPVEAAAFVGRDARRYEVNGFEYWSAPFTVSGARLRADLSRLATQAAASQGVLWPVSAEASLTGLSVDGRYAVELGAMASPYPGVVVGGAAAVDATGDVPGGPRPSLGEAPRMMRLEGAARLTPELSVAAGYRQVDAAFNPLYQEMVTDDEGNRIDWLANNRGEKGVTLGVRTVQQGVTVQAMVDSYERWLDDSGNPVGPEGVTRHRDGELAASTTLRGVELSGLSRFDLMGGIRRTETQLSAAYPVAMPGLSVKPKYELTVDAAGGVAHTLSAEARTDRVPYFPGLEARGHVARSADGQWSYGAGLSYRAPNGLAVGISHDSAKGAWVQAGLSAQF